MGHIWRIDSLVFPDCGEFVLGKGYFNSNSGKYVSRKYDWMGSEVPKRYVRYEFSIYDDVDIMNDFGIALVDRVGRFLSMLYKKRMNSVSDDKYVYVSNKELSGILGEGKYKDVIVRLREKSLVSTHSGRRLKYNANKKLLYFELNNEFFGCVKRLRYIKNRRLFKYLDTKVEYKFDKENKFLRYEIDVIKRLRIDNDIDVEELVSERIKLKKNEDLNDVFNVDLLRSIDRKNLYKRLNDVENDWDEEYEKYYRKKLISDFDFFKDSIVSVKYGEYHNLMFADSFSGRMYNPVNCRFKECRSVLKLDNERLVEIDLKNSYISLLYLVFLVLNDKVSIGIGGEEIKERLGVVTKGRLFLKEYKDIFEDNKYDFYKYVGAKLMYIEGVVSENLRKYLKRTVLSLLNTRKSFEDKKQFFGRTYEQFMKVVFMSDGYRFIEYVKNNDVFDRWYSEDVFASFKSYVNMSKLLMRMEVIVMKIVFDRLINEGIEYVSLFDGFMVKESEKDRVINIVNAEIEGFKCLRFASK